MSFEKKQPVCSLSWLFLKPEIGYQFSYIVCKYIESVLNNRLCSVINHVEKSSNASLKIVEVLVIVNRLDYWWRRFIISLHLFPCGMWSVLRERQAMRSLITCPAVALWWSAHSLGMVDVSLPTAYISVVAVEVLPRDLAPENKLQNISCATES